MASTNDEAMSPNLSPSIIARQIDILEDDIEKCPDREERGRMAREQARLKAQLETAYSH